MSHHPHCLSAYIKSINSTCKGYGPKKQQREARMFSILVHAAHHPTPTPPATSCPTSQLWGWMWTQDAQPDPRSQRSSRQRSSRGQRTSQGQRSSQPGPHSQRSSDETWPSSHGGEEAALTERDEDRWEPRSLRAKQELAHLPPYQSPYISTHPQGRGHAKPTAKEAYL